MVITKHWQDNIVKPMWRTALNDTNQGQPAVLVKRAIGNEFEPWAADWGSRSTHRKNISIRQVDADHNCGLSHTNTIPPGAQGLMADNSQSIAKDL